MKSTYLLGTKSALSLYQGVKDLPIIDYHCHLSPKEIFEDKQFDNIGEMLLSGDHYKWRLMRAFGIDEFYITGNATWWEKFIRYAEVISTAAGNPLYHWTMMELSIYFGIDQPLNGNTAEMIWQQANLKIKDLNLSPRKLITMSNVKFIATTDDVIDDLLFHKKISDDNTFSVTVVPSFRVDNLLLIKRSNYTDYISRLSVVSGVNITDIHSFEKSINNRLDFFLDNGCRFSDIGIEYFPDHISTWEQADCTFKKALLGEEIAPFDYLGFLGYMYVFLAGEYKKRNIVMQWHLAVKRNANTEQFERLGADIGGDCIGDIIPNRHIIRILDAINIGSGLPKTILYTLNPTMCTSLATIAGSFPNVTCGASWWFCDHKRGIVEQIETIAQTGHIGTFLGMLTDSRSFLSYARFDYFRRILCDIIGGLLENGEFADIDSAEKLAFKICFENINTVVKGENI